MGVIFHVFSFHHQFSFLCSHDVELRKVKEVQAAAEKLRRERWIDEKTKKIKVWAHAHSVLTAFSLHRHTLNIGHATIKVC